MKKHIVIIEDNRELLEVMQIIFEGVGYKTTCLSSISTIEELIGLQADCFILDEQLPVINGHIICIILRTKAATKNVPVILVSAHPEIEGYATLCEATAFLKKPFNEATDILHLVTKVLDGAAQQVL